MHDRSLAVALAQSGPRGRWRRGASKPRWLPQQHKTSAGMQTHAQLAYHAQHVECVEEEDTRVPSVRMCILCVCLLLNFVGWRASHAGFLVDSAHADIFLPNVVCFRNAWMNEGRTASARTDSPFQCLEKGKYQIHGLGANHSSCWPIHARVLVVPCLFLRINSVGRWTSFARVVAASMRFVGDAVPWTRTFSSNRRSHISSCLSSVPRGCKNAQEFLSRRRTREVGTDPIFQDWKTSVAVGGGSSVDEFGVLGDERCTDKANLLHKLAFACSDILPRP